MDMPLKDSPSERKERGCRTLLFLLLLTVAGLLAHVFTLNWEQPSPYEHVPDCAVPRPGWTAREMFYAGAMAYGPLHYTILNLFSPGGGRDLTERDPEYLTLSGRRIVAFRAVAAAMSILTALALFLIARIGAGLPDLWSFAAALAFQLLPGTLYYSHTSNMDLPCLFWLTLAVLAACLAFRAEKKPDRIGSTAWNLAAGILLACSFCTKDQVYAVCILPAAVYALLRFRDAGGRTGLRRWAHALTPHFLWLLTFAACTVLIYWITAGPDGAAAHWKFISGEGKDDFFQAGASFAGRMKLVWDSLIRLGAFLDPAGLLLLAAAAAGWGLALNSGGGKDLVRRNGMLWLYGLAALISQQVLFYQVVRRCEFRWNLPLAALMMIVIFSGIRQAALRKPKPVTIFLIFVFLLQGAAACSFLFDLRESPLTRLAAEMKEAPEQKICVLSAARGHAYAVLPGGEYVRIPTIRSWIGPNYGLLPRDQLVEAENDLFSCFWLDAKIILLPADAELRPEFRRVFSEPESAAYLRKRVLFSFCPVGPREFRLLPRRKDAPSIREAADRGLFAAFAERSAEDQLLTLTFLLRKESAVPRESLAVLGHLLKPFSPPDMTKADISPRALGAAGIAYVSAGRNEDAEPLRKFLETRYPMPGKPENTPR